MAKLAVINYSGNPKKGRGYNLATSKMRALFESQGHEVAYSVRADYWTYKAQKAYCSALFTYDLPKLITDIPLMVQNGLEIEAGGPGVTAMMTSERPEMVQLTKWFNDNHVKLTAGLDERFEHVKGDFESTFSSRGCPRACEFCVPVNTKILMEDLTWQNIQEIKIGDKIIGVKKQGDFCFYPGVVTDTMKRRAEVWAIETENGTTHSTMDHPWLMGRGFRTLRENKYGTRDVLRKIATPQENFTDTDDYRLGYIIGVIEGDGYLGSKPGQHVCRIVGEYEMLDAVLQFSDELGLPFYAANFNGGIIYHNVTRSVKCSRKVICDGIKDIIANPPTTFEFIRGWVAGIYDAEGSWSSAIRISNFDPILIERIEKYTHYLGFKTVVEKNGTRILGGLPENIRFIGLIKPRVKHLTQAWIGHQIHNKTKISKVYSIGIQDVYNLSTSLETFIADGFVTHNCLVSKLEGRKIVEYSDFTIPVGKHPFVCDNNILSTSWGHQKLFVDKLKGVRRLDINSGFDDRIFIKDPEKYWNLYSQLDLITWRFAYDQDDQREVIKACADFLHTKGVNYRNIQVFCLTGWPGTTFEYAREKLQYLIDIGTSPYAMNYRPLDSLKMHVTPPGWHAKDMEKLFAYYNVAWNWKTCKWEDFVYPKRKSMTLSRDTDQAKF